MKEGEKGKFFHIALPHKNLLIVVEQLEEGVEHCDGKIIGTS